MSAPEVISRAFGEEGGASARMIAAHFAVAAGSL